MFISLQASDNATILGLEVLKNFDVFPERNWFWIGAAALLGFILLFNILFTFALMYLNRKNSDIHFKYKVRICSHNHKLILCLLFNTNSSWKATSYNL